MQRWVDIENDYYEALKVTLNNPNADGHDEKTELLSELNSCFSAIIEQLEEYLRSLEPAQKIFKYDAIFNSRINYGR